MGGLWAMSTPQPARRNPPGGLYVGRLVTREPYSAPSARFQFAMFQYENS